MWYWVYERTILVYRMFDYVRVIGDFSPESVYSVQ